MICCTSRDRAQQLPDAAVGEGLALQRDQDRVGGGEAVERHDAQRRRAVDDDDVEMLPHRGERPLERELATRPHQQHRVGAGEVDGRGQQRHPVGRLEQHLLRVRVTGDHVVDRLVEAVGVVPERERETALRIEVHDQHGVPSPVSAAPSEATVVVFATPPFWLATASTVVTGTFLPSGYRILPCRQFRHIARISAPVAGRSCPSGAPGTA